MLNRLLFGSGTEIGVLRESLGHSTTRMREIAHRVSNVTNGVDEPFSRALSQVSAAGGEDSNGPEVDLEKEMVALANEQIRFDAGASLLQRAYARLRASVRGV